MLTTLKRYGRRFRQAMNVFRTGQYAEKQFAFIWHDPATRNNVQWHLVDYETYAKEGYSMNALANIAIKYKTDSFALVSMRAYSGDVDRPKPLPQKNRLQQLITRPNPFQSFFQFMQLADTYYNIDGNAFIYKKPSADGNPIPEALYNLRPDHVYIKPIEKDGRGDILFLYVPFGRDFPNGIPIESRDMMHIKTPNPLDPLEGMGYGLPGLMPVAQLIDQDNMQTQFLYNIFKHQGIMPGGYLEVPFELDDDDMMKLRREFEDAYGGHDKWGRPIILDGGAVYKPGAFTLDQLDVSALDKRIVKRTNAIFGVPAMLVGLDDESSTFSNMAEADESFWKRTMKAELKVFGDEFYWRLRDENKDWFVDWDTSDVPAYQEDLLEASEIFSRLVEHGVSPNEAALRVNLNIAPIVGGDVSFILANLVPIEQLLNPSAPQAPTGNLPADDEDNEDETEPETTPDNDVEDIPDDNSTETRSISLKSRWDYELKDGIWKAVDDIAQDNEDEFAVAAREAFAEDKAKVAEIIKKNTKTVISWTDVRRNIDLYLSTTGLTNWRNHFIPAIIELSRQQTDYWSRIAPDIFPPTTFSLRNVQAESWFNTYVLQFASAVNDTTRNDIHRIIADGMEGGLSNDQIANRLLGLFEQYTEGNTDPETWAFLQERMPDYRLEMIARTETHGAMSAGNHSLFQQAGVERKEWLATPDSRTRDSHLVAWNRYSEGGNPGPIPLDHDFIVGGFHMKYPGDRRAPIHLWIQCRCVELPFLT